ncbi:MAG TPA: NAD(P)-binding domain-containing protein [Syntrophales bacterium]|nr:NAD(P)-binding domain-containing protein [Syntrophales bacterium]HQF75508.1 NAD(P)-binding domain-containing protein [Syntrophales bacterium]
MPQKTMGFVGGGRITRIILEALGRKRMLPATVIVSDVSGDALQRLRERFPKVQTVQGDNARAAGQDIVFLALHPPAVAGGLEEIKAALKPGAVLVSLAPRFTIRALSEGLGGFDRIVRMIPNAPSIVGEGYNPVAFGPGISREEKTALSKLFKKLGGCPEVDEDKLEAYALITAAGPTYIWFQLFELFELGKSFGLTDKQAWKGIKKMLKGAVETVDEAGLSPEEVMDLVPMKPLGEEEAVIRNAYRTKLTGLYRKLKG